MWEGCVHKKDIMAKELSSDRGSTIESSIPLPQVVGDCGNIKVCTYLGGQIDMKSSIIPRFV